MADTVMFDLELGVDIDKQKLSKEILSKLKLVQHEVDGNGIQIGAYFDKDTFKNLGKQLLDYTKSLNKEQIGKLFDDKKIQKEVNSVIDDLSKIEDKIKELESKDIKLDSNALSQKIKDLFSNYDKAIYNRDILDSEDKPTQHYKSASKILINNLKELLSSTGQAKEIQEIIKSQGYYSDTLANIEDDFKNVKDLNFIPKIDFSSFKKDNSELDALVKERENIFEKMASIVFNWSNENFGSIMNKMTADIEVTPKISDNFEDDAKKVINEIDLKADVNLVPNVDKEKFKQEAETLLSGTEIKTDVSLKIDGKNVSVDGNVNVDSMTSNNARSSNNNNQIILPQSGTSLGTNISEWASADKIMNELNYFLRKEKGAHFEPRERAMFYNNTTNDASNPFLSDKRQSSLTIYSVLSEDAIKTAKDTDELLRKAYKEAEKYTTQIHSHVGRKFVTPSGEGGDLTNALRSYNNTSKNVYEQMIVGGDEVLIYDLKKAEEAYNALSSEQKSAFKSFDEFWNSIIKEYDDYKPPKTVVFKNMTEMVNMFSNFRSFADNLINSQFEIDQQGSDETIVTTLKEKLEENNIDKELFIKSIEDAFNGEKKFGYNDFNKSYGQFSKNLEQSFKRNLKVDEDLAYSLQDYVDIVVSEIEMGLRENVGGIYAEKYKQNYLSSLFEKYGAKDAIQILSIDEFKEKYKSTYESFNNNQNLEFNVDIIPKVAESFGKDAQALIDAALDGIDASVEVKPVVSEKFDFDEFMNGIFDDTSSTKNINKQAEKIVKQAEKYNYDDLSIVLGGRDPSKRRHTETEIKSIRSNTGEQLKRLLSEAFNNTSSTDLLTGLMSGGDYLSSYEEIANGIKNKFKMGKQLTEERLLKIFKPLFNAEYLEYGNAEDILKDENILKMYKQIKGKFDTKAVKSSDVDLYKKLIAMKQKDDYVKLDPNFKKNIDEELDLEKAISDLTTRNLKINKKEKVNYPIKDFAAYVSYLIEEQEKITSLIERVNQFKQNTNPNFHNIINPDDEIGALNRLKENLNWQQRYIERVAPQNGVDLKQAQQTISESMETSVDSSSFAKRIENSIRSAIESIGKIEINIVANKQVLEDSINDVVDGLKKQEIEVEIKNKQALYDEFDEMGRKLRESLELDLNELISGVDLVDKLQVENALSKVAELATKLERIAEIDFSNIGSIGSNINIGDIGNGANGQVTQQDLKNQIVQVNSIVNSVADIFKMWQEADRIDARNEPKMRGTERSLAFNAKTGKMTNPFMLGEDGSVPWKDFAGGDGDYNFNRDKLYDTIVHSHAGDYFVVPSESRGDLSVAIQQYKNGVQDMIIVATNEVLEWNMEEIRERLKEKWEKDNSQYAINKYSDNQFEKDWNKIVSSLETQTKQAKSKYFNASEFGHYLVANNNHDSKIFDVYDDSKYSDIEKKEAIERSFKLSMNGIISELDYAGKLNERAVDVRDKLSKGSANFDSIFNEYFNELKSSNVFTDNDLMKLIAKYANKYFKQEYGYKKNIVDKNIVDGGGALYDMHNYRNAFNDAMNYNYNTNIKASDYGFEGADRVSRDYWLKAVKALDIYAMQKAGIGDLYQIMSIEEFDKKHKNDYLGSAIRQARINTPNNQNANKNNNNGNNIFTDTDLSRLDDIYKKLKDIYNVLNTMDTFSIDEMFSTNLIDQLEQITSFLDMLKTYETINKDISNILFSNTGDDGNPILKSYGNIMDILDKGSKGGKIQEDVENGIKYTNKDISDIFKKTIGIEIDGINGIFDLFMDMSKQLNLGTWTEFSFESTIDNFKENADINETGYLSEFDLAQLSNIATELNDYFEDNHGRKPTIDDIKDLSIERTYREQSTIFHDIFNQLGGNTLEIFDEDEISDIDRLNGTLKELLNTLKEISNFTNALKIDTKEEIATKYGLRIADLFNENNGIRAVMRENEINPKKDALGKDYFSDDDYKLLLSKNNIEIEENSGLLTIVNLLRNVAEEFNIAQENAEEFYNSLDNLEASARLDKLGITPLDSSSRRNLNTTINELYHSLSIDDFEPLRTKPVESTTTIFDQLLAQVKNIDVMPQITVSSGNVSDTTVDIEKLNEVLDQLYNTLNKLNTEDGLKLFSFDKATIQAFSDAMDELKSKKNIDSDIGNEQEDINKLDNALKEVNKKIQEKNTLFKTEQAIVSETVGDEVKNLLALSKVIGSINENITKLGTSFMDGLININDTELKKKIENIITNIPKDARKIDIEVNIPDNINDSSLNKIKTIFQTIKDSLNGLNIEKSIDDIVGLFDKIKISDSDIANISKIFDPIKELKESLESLTFDDNNGFVTQLTNILQYSSELENLATILSKTKNEFENVTGVIIDDNDPYELYKKSIEAQDKYFEARKKSLNKTGNIVEDERNRLEMVAAYKQMIDLEKKLALIQQEDGNGNYLDVLTQRKATLESEMLKTNDSENALAYYEKIKDTLSEIDEVGKKIANKGGFDVLPDNSKLLNQYEKLNKELDKTIGILKILGLYTPEVEKSISSMRLGVDNNYFKQLDAYKKENGIDLTENQEKIKQYKDNAEKYVTELQRLLSNKKAPSNFELDELNALYKEMQDSLSAVRAQTSLTKEEQKEFDNVLKNVTNTISELDGNLDKIALDKLQNVKFDFDSKAFDKIKDQFLELRKKAGNISSRDEYFTFLQDFDNLSEQYKIFEKLFNKSTRVESFGSYEEALQKLRSEAQQFGTVIKETGDIEPNGKGIAKYTLIVKDATGETKKMAIEWNEAVRSMALSEKMMGNTGRTGVLGFLDNIKKKIYDVTSYMAGIYLSPMDWIRYIQGGIQYVREMDTALTEMRKVSDESLQSLKQYQLTTFDAARNIGVKASDLQNSTADWMRLGESLTNAAESAKDTAVLFNVSEFDSITDATQSLVAISQAYTDLDKMTIIDKLNEVGNNYSISTDELSTGLQKSASTLSLMGNTIDETAALITAGELHCLSF